MRQDGSSLIDGRPVKFRLACVVVLVVLTGSASATADDEVPAPPPEIPRLAQAPQPAPTPAGAQPLATPNPVPASPRAQPVPQRSAPRPATTTDARPRGERTRMARSPEMFGDQFLSSPILLNGGLNPLSTFTNFGTLGAPGSIHAFSQKVSENNHPLPRDRVYYTFNLWEDALKFNSSLDGGLLPASQAQSLMRHTVGIEKTFFDGESSLEFRLPFYDGTTYSRAVGADSFAYDGGTVGNLMITGKTILYEVDGFVTSIGLGVNTPTGDDATLRVNSSTAKIDNQAVYLSPFIGSLWTPSDNWFVTGFSQIQVSTNGDSVIVSDPSLQPRDRVATVQAPAALSFDLSLGRWLFRDRSDAFVQGMALVGEVHQFAALQDTDGIPTPDPQSFGVRARDERLSLTTLTFGVHSLLAGNSTLRVAGVVPMNNDQFDGELIVQFNVFF